MEGTSNRKHLSTTLSLQSQSTHFFLQSVQVESVLLWVPFPPISAGCACGSEGRWGFWGWLRRHVAPWVPRSSPSNWCRWGLWLPQWSLFCQSGTHQPVRYRVVTDAAGMVGKACCCCRVAETHELLSKLKKYSLICTLSYSTLNIKILNTV